MWRSAFLWSTRSAIQCKRFTETPPSSTAITSYSSVHHKTSNEKSKLTFYLICYFTLHEKYKPINLIHNSKSKTLFFQLMHQLGPGEETEKPTRFSETWSERFALTEVDENFRRKMRVPAMSPKRWWWRERI